jgi:VanZ family protein
MRRFLYTRPKPGGLLARAGLLAALVAVSVGSVIDPGTTAAAGLNDKLQHVLAFALLGLLGCAAMPERARWRWVLPVLLGYGLLIECVQWWLPWREFSVLDLAADLVGLLVVLGPLERWQRSRGEGRA